MKVQGVSFNFNKGVSLKNHNLIKNDNVNIGSGVNNIYFSDIPFKRSWKEHKSWGAFVDPKTKEVTFKIFTYPDTKRVSVSVKKADNRIIRYDLENKGGGIFETPYKISPDEIQHGDSYFYTIERVSKDKTKNAVNVKDPYSYRQKKLTDESVIYDHSLYKWEDSNWFLYDKRRISRTASNKNGLTPLNKARIYEFNTVSLTQGGTFEDAKKVLKNLPLLGFNAIEIMPVENTYSFNWGYDGADKFAPSEHLGGPDGLKSLIDYAHSIGLNVIMDMVPNHISDDGQQLDKTGPYIDCKNCFGLGFNYEKENSRYVRDYMVNAAINWLENYHCDGLRLDMTKFMLSDYTMKQIAAEINYHKSDAFLIAEDARDSMSVSGDNYWHNRDEVHDRRVVNPLNDKESAINKTEKEHIEAIENISNNQTSLARLGYDSEWDFNFFHKLKHTIFGSVDLSDIEKASYCAQNNVKYLMSHDEIGNMDGTRLIAKLMSSMLHLKEGITLNEEEAKRIQQIQKLWNCSAEEAYEKVTNQKSEMLSNKLATMFQTGELDKYDLNIDDNMQNKDEIRRKFEQEIIKPLGISPDLGITYDKIKAMFDKSFDINKMAITRVFATPGPKMVFQGDESCDLTPFKFFRELGSKKSEPNLYLEKGYRTDKEALKQSKLFGIEYSQRARVKMNAFRRLVRDLNIINANNSALSCGRFVLEDTIKHPYSQVIAMHARDDIRNNSLYSITNFGNQTYPDYDSESYYIEFPEGEWVEILNTDDNKYSGKGNINRKIIKSDGNKKYPINLSAKTTTIFKKID